MYEWMDLDTESQKWYPITFAIFCLLKASQKSPPILKGWGYIESVNMGFTLESAYHISSVSWALKTFIYSLNAVRMNDLNIH